MQETLVGLEQEEVKRVRRKIEVSYSQNETKLQITVTTQNSLSIILEIKQVSGKVCWSLSYDPALFDHATLLQIISEIEDDEKVNDILQTFWNHEYVKLLFGLNPKS